MDILSNMRENCVITMFQYARHRGSNLADTHHTTSQYTYNCENLKQQAQKEEAEKEEDV